MLPAKLLDELADALGTIRTVEDVRVGDGDEGEAMALHRRHLYGWFGRPDQRRIKLRQ